MTVEKRDYDGSVSALVPPRFHILPPPLRRFAAAAVMVCSVVLVSLGVAVAGNSRAGAIDHRVSGLVLAALTENAVPVSRRLISWGDGAPVALVAVALAAVALGMGHRRCALLAIIGPFLTGVTTTGMKPLVGRTISGHLAYPSGHAGGWTALGLVAAILVIAVLSARVVTSVLLLLGGVAAGFLMSIALITVGTHYPSDTVGGVCAAIAVVLGVCLLLERIRPPATARTQS